jgi:hypothetical protein
MAKKVSAKPIVPMVEASGASAVPAPAKKTTRPRTAPGEVKADAVRKSAPRKSSPEVEQTPTPLVVKFDLDKDEVARLAYSYWEARGYQGGSPMDDWIRAEKELREQTLAFQN